MSKNETSEARRDTLKIIGAIGTTCAFPFSANELYGQQDHQHPDTQPPVASATPYTPKFFNADEFKIVSRVADLIIPETDTPGAIKAGVPQYIDEVVGRSKDMQIVFRGGTAWLSGKNFLTLSEPQQIALLAPLSEAVDLTAAAALKSPEEKFFRAIKNVTADGYYTSYAGLVTELGYQGNQALASFPSCELPKK